VHGKVQGVGYRFFAFTCAEALGIAGWVRNAADGTVEAFAEGSEGQLREFAFDLRRGPRYGRVARLDEESADLQGLESFKILRPGS
jgi:acylphosphatase